MTIRSQSRLARATMMVSKNFMTSAKDLSKELNVGMDSAHNLLYSARKKLNLFKVGRGKNAVWKQRARILTAKDVIAKAVDIVATHHTDMVNHPSHYTKGGIETIDFIEAKQLNYNLGNVVKYITRADHKGEKHEDLCKARWYLNREIAKLSK